MIQDVLSDAQLQQLNNKAVARWLKQLESLAFEADALLDDFNYEILRQKVKNAKKHFSALELFKSILETLTVEDTQLENREAILKKLQKEFQGKRYLLVLDDVWIEESDKWDDFINPLSVISSVKGNGIIVTTRSAKVASIVKTFPVYKLSSLSEDNCWSIIKVKAFKDGDIPTAFEVLGESFAVRCKGVPLAAKILGGLLYDKSEDERLSILESPLSDLKGDESSITKLLKLSFDYLPSSSLKKCFSYCAVFPKDFEIERKQLIQLWMAEGFLQSDQGNDMEAVGNIFFSHFLHNSFFEDVRRDDYGNVTHCKMHDFVHDLACSVSGARVIDVNDIVSSDFDHIRYLGINYARDEPYSFSREQAKYVRTFIFRGAIANNFFSDFRYLHVLKLMHADIKELPSSIGKLHHLRFLDISGTPIKILSDSIGKLYNLQTLRTINRYRHHLKALPHTIINLIKLRHLHIPPTQLPPGIGKLTCLRTLPYYKIQLEQGCGIGELGSLRNLEGELYIENLERVNDRKEAKHAGLFGKPKILKLSLAWYGYRGGEINDENVLEGLEPHPNLKSLRISGYKGKNFPLWIMKMSVYNDLEGYWIGLNSLVNMELNNCYGSEEIPMLGHLPHLKSLYLFNLPNVKCISLSFYGVENGTTSNPPFPALERLELCAMQNLTEWLDAEVATSVFPCLKYLTIERCPKLKSAPSRFSCLNELIINKVDADFPLSNVCCSDLTSLRELKIVGMPGLVSLPDWLFVKNQKLTFLVIQNCPNTTHLVTGSLNGGESLRELKIWNCGNLRELPDDLITLQSLVMLHISGCPDLRLIPHRAGKSKGLASLELLEIRNCKELATFPSEMLESCSSSLKNLTITNMENLLNFPLVSNTLKMPRLTDLDISDLTKLMNFPIEMSSLTSLRSLTIGRFSDSLSLASFNDTLSGIFLEPPCLQWLFLKGREHWDTLPDQLQHLTSLKELKLWDFGVEALPEWFGNLSSLETLDINACKKLTHLPSKEVMQRLSQLSIVWITGCP